MLGDRHSIQRAAVFAGITLVMCAPPGESPVPTTTPQAQVLPSPTVFLSPSPSPSPAPPLLSPTPRSSPTPSELEVCVAAVEMLGREGCPLVYSAPADTCVWLVSWGGVPGYEVEDMSEDGCTDFLVEHCRTECSPSGGFTGTGCSPCPKDYPPWGERLRCLLLSGEPSMCED